MASSDKKYPPLVLELKDRRPSSFVMKGTENTENPDFLDCPSEFLLLPEAYAMIGGSRKKIRYIHNCEFITVEDQKKHDQKPTPRQDVIVFSFGRLTVERSGAYIGLYDFLCVHPGNSDIPKDKRPPGATDVFYQINTSAKAEKNLLHLPDTTFVVNAMNDLMKTTRKDDVDKVEYDETRIDYLVKLLGVVPLDSYAEKLDILLTTALANPAYFRNLLSEVTGDMRVEITTARELGVISLDGPDASFVADSKPFYKFKEKKDVNKRVAELVKYFGTQEAEMDLAVLRTQVGFAKEAQLKEQ